MADREPAGRRDGLAASRRATTVLTTLAVMSLALFVRGLVALDAGRPPPAPGLAVELPIEHPPLPTGEVSRPCLWLDGRDWGCAAQPLAPGADDGRFAVVDPMTIVFVVDGGVEQLVLPGGELGWRSEVLAHEPDASVMAADGALFALAPDAITRLDPATGAAFWSTRLSASSRAAPRVWSLDGDLLVLDDHGVLRALAGESGEVLWNRAGFRADVTMTAHGLVLGRGTDIGSWHPRSPEPLWIQADVAGHAAELPPGALIGVVDGRDLPVDPRTGRRLQFPGGSVVEVRTAGGHAIWLVLSWSADEERLDVQAFGDDATPLWRQPDVTLPCCEFRVRPADGERIAIATAAPAVVLAAGDGRILDYLQRPGLRLDALAGGVELWRSEEELVGIRAVDDVEVMRGVGEVVMLDPLLVTGPDGIFHIPTGGAD